MVSVYLLLSVMLVSLINIMYELRFNRSVISNISSVILEISNKICPQTLDRQHEENIQGTKRDIEKSTEAKGT